ncbi:Hypothetical protein CINCED_3A019026 [Cinara cedri]|uniref:Actin maturation protease n=1 Tax=Cinara cedri TaxID=506608 RepID=A0A5E4MRB3_9HEMI|nr:Hypothetical protein CINCED_3A019026 [Cinara cedri]
MNQEPHSPTLLDDNYDEEVVRLYPSGSVSSFSEILDNNIQMDTMDSDQIAPISGGAPSENDETFHSSNNLNDLNNLNLDLNVLNSSSSSDSSDNSSHHNPVKNPVRQNIVQGNLSEFIESLIDTLVSENTEIATIIDMIRKKLSREEYIKWLSLTYMLASVHPYKNEARISPIFPGTNTFVRAIRMVLGPRGMVHGWTGKLPDLNREIQIDENINCVWPKRWAPHSDSDGNSSFRSDSSGEECFANRSGAAWCNGPRGVADGRLPITETTMVSETSSCLSEDSMPESRLDIYPLKGCRSPDQVQKLKRLDNYLQQSNHERIHRREIRRARRIQRSRYDHQRRLMDPAYDLEVKRAVIIEADRIRHEREALDKKAAEEKIIQSNFRKKYRESRRNRFKPQNSPKKPIPTSHLCESFCPIFDLRTAIGIQVCETWTKLYGRFIETAEEPMTFHCWVTPVRWVKQEGPNCGLAVLSMAARPMLTCEGLLYGSTNIATDAVSGTEDITINLAAVKNAQLQNQLNKKCQINFVVPDLIDYYDVAIDAGYTSFGEMFSARVMAQLADFFRPGQHSIDLVREDWTTPQTPRTTPPQTPKKGHCCKTESDDCEEKKTYSGKSLLDSDKPSTSAPVKSFNRTVNGPNQSKIQILENTKITHIKEYSSKDAHSPYQWNLESGRPLPAYMYTPIKLVQRLIRGDLIAVCFDCDKNMLPSSKNKGTTAHWALLCGVIIAKKTGDVERPKYRYDPNTKNVLQDDLDRDVDKIWMIGRHGKNNGQYVVWSFRELLESNRQLSTPAPKILNTIPDELKALWYNDERDLKPLFMRNETRLQLHRYFDEPAYNDSDEEYPILSPNNSRNNLPPLPKSEPMPYMLSDPAPLPRLPLFRHPTSDANRRSFLLPDGPRLDLCLANQYVGFRPLYKPNTISFFDHPHNTHSDDDSSNQLPVQSSHKSSSSSSRNSSKCPPKSLSQNSLSKNSSNNSPKNSFHNSPNHSSQCSSHVSLNNSPERFPSNSSDNLFHISSNNSPEKFSPNAPKDFTYHSPSNSSYSSSQKSSPDSRRNYSHNSPKNSSQCSSHVSPKNSPERFPSNSPENLFHISSNNSPEKFSPNAPKDFTYHSPSNSSCSSSQKSSPDSRRNYSSNSPDNSSQCSSLVSPNNSPERFPSNSPDNLSPNALKDFTYHSPSNSSCKNLFHNSPEKFSPNAPKDFTYHSPSNSSNSSSQKSSSDSRRNYSHNMPNNLSHVLPNNSPERFPSNSPENLFHISSNNSPEKFSPNAPKDFTYHSPSNSSCSSSQKSSPDSRRNYSSNSPDNSSQCSSLVSPNNSPERFPSNSPDNLSPNALKDFTYHSPSNSSCSSSQKSSPESRRNYSHNSPKNSSQCSSHVSPKNSPERFPSNLPENLFHNSPEKFSPNAPKDFTYHSPSNSSCSSSQKSSPNSRRNYSHNLPNNSPEKFSPNTPENFTYHSPSNSSNSSSQCSCSTSPNSSSSNSPNSSSNNSPEKFSPNTPEDFTYHSQSSSSHHTPLNSPEKDSPDSPDEFPYRSPNNSPHNSPQKSPIKDSPDSPDDFPYHSPINSSHNSPHNSPENSSRYSSSNSSRHLSHNSPKNSRHSSPNSSQKSSNDSPRNPPRIKPSKKSLGHRLTWSAVQQHNREEPPVKRYRFLEIPKPHHHDE